MNAQFAYRTIYIGSVRYDYYAPPYMFIPHSVSLFMTKYLYEKQFNNALPFQQQTNRYVEAMHMYDNKLIDVQRKASENGRQ